MIKQPDSFGKRLRAAMGGRTQVEVASISGVRQSIISELLSEKYQPTLSTAAALARSLGVSVDSLVPEPEKRSKTTAHRKKSAV